MTLLETTVQFNRIYLAIFFTFVAVFYTGRILLQKNKLKSDVVHQGKTFCKSWWNHQLFKLFRLLIWVICLARVFSPDLDSSLILISPLNLTPVLILGTAIMTFGFAMTLKSHFDMADHWRSGIDTKNADKLITTGAFAWSRNPMFLSVAITQLGFFLALPSLFTLLCLMLGWWTLTRQISLEEAFLNRTFPKEYPQYTSRVPRWL